MKSTILAGIFATGAVAQSGPWGQCGGQNWSGSKDCVSGYQCQFVNDWYSVIKPTSTTTSAPAASTSTTPSKGKFKWFGINQSVAEFGQGEYPGVWGKHFTFPSTDSMRTLINDGYNSFRVAFSAERLAPNQLTAPLDPAYLKNLTETVNFITNAGAWAIIEPHNFGRYYGNIITDKAAFGTFWTNVAKQYASNPRVVFDTNNEYHDMDQNLVFDLNQAAINAIRGAGATSQYIFVEGNSWSGAWTWNVTNNNLAALTDPQNKLVYEMHQYLDSDGSGTNENCVSTEIGVQRVIGATKWLKDNGKLGVLGEFAGGPNSVCKTAVTGLLNHLQENSDVWTGAFWWAAGPWWSTYMFSLGKFISNCLKLFRTVPEAQEAEGDREGSGTPPSGTAYLYYNSLLKQYM
ncbi:Endoglucanase 3 [Collariella sp. IMI 366227]|nr:Endoglucanase 3 [Collariella sp. IMI 366227]